MHKVVYSSIKGLNRYELIYRIEKNLVDKDEDVWYIKDTTKKRHGIIVAKIFNKALAEMALEYWNGKKKIPVTRKHKLQLLE